MSVAAFRSPLIDHVPRDSTLGRQRFRTSVDARKQFLRFRIDFVSAPIRVFHQDIKREFRDERFGFGVELIEVFAHWIEAAGAGRGGDSLHGRRPIFSCLLLSLFVRIAGMTCWGHSGGLRGQPLHHRCPSFGACLLIRFLFFPEPLSGFRAFFVKPATESQGVEERGGNDLDRGKTSVGAILQPFPDLGHGEIPRVLRRRFLLSLVIFAFGGTHTSPSSVSSTA